MPSRIWIARICMYHNLYRELPVYRNICRLDTPQCFTGAHIQTHTHTSVLLLPQLYYHSPHVGIDYWLHEKAKLSMIWNKQKKNTNTSYVHTCNSLAFIFYGTNGQTDYAFDADQEYIYALCDWTPFTPFQHIGLLKNFLNYLTMSHIERHIYPESAPWVVDDEWKKWNWETPFPESAFVLGTANRGHSNCLDPNPDRRNAQKQLTQLRLNLNFMQPHSQLFGGQTSWPAGRSSNKKTADVVVNAA